MLENQKKVTQDLMDHNTSLFKELYEIRVNRDSDSINQYRVKPDPDDENKYRVQPKSSRDPIWKV